MRVTGIRIKGVRPTHAQLTKIAVRLEQSFKRAGFNTGVYIENSTALNITAGGSTFRVNTERLGHNYRVNRSSLASTKAGYKRSNLPTWDQRVEFNHAINDVLDAMSVTARVTAAHGEFVVRTHDGRVNSWYDNSGNSNWEWLITSSESEAADQVASLGGSTLAKKREQREQREREYAEYRARVELKESIKAVAGGRLITGRSKAVLSVVRGGK